MSPPKFLKISLFFGAAVTKHGGNHCRPIRQRNFVDICSKRKIIAESRRYYKIGWNAEKILMAYSFSTRKKIIALTKNYIWTKQQTHIIKNRTRRPIKQKIKYEQLNKNWWESGGAGRRATHTKSARGRTSARDLAGEGALGMSILAKPTDNASVENEGFCTNLFWEK